MAHERLRASAKRTRLQQWGESENDDFLAQLDDENDVPTENFQTLKLGAPTGSLPGLSPPLKLPAARPTISPGMFMRFVEPEHEEMSFEQDYSDHHFNMENVKMNQCKQALMSRDPKLLPGTLLSALPLRRRSLSDYSEGTDTDITEMNDEDFEELDDIFGKEESGIYSSGSTKASNAENVSRASEVLLRKKQQLQREAEIEDHRMYQRYRRQHGDEVNTLKLKDLKSYRLSPNLNKDPLENEHTVNYEYTRDDFEVFEDGFEGDLPRRLEPSKLKQFQSSLRSLSHKVSLPSFPNTLKASKPTKFKSTMDLAGHLRDADEHPIFNKSNKLIRKLDRMPSFHIKRTERVELIAADNEKLEADMELRKKQLLEKYMEISEQQKILRSSPTRKLKQTHPRKGVGLVKYLNDKLAVPTTAGNENMKFNAASKRWEGNEHDLVRFEDDIPETKKQPSLITRAAFQNEGETLKGNMRYDPENMRWVNLDVVEEEENVFDDVPDLVPNDIPQYLIPRAPSKHMLNERGVSTFTQRTVLTVSSDRSSAKSTSAGEEFQLNAKLLARFDKEEQKITKKTHHWFGPNEHYHTDHSKAFNPEYFWDIRKMVMDNGGTNS